MLVTDLGVRAGRLSRTTAIALVRERVRRAEIGLELLERHYPEAVASKLPAEALAVPVQGWRRFSTRKYGPGPMCRDAGVHNVDDHEWCR